MTQERMIPKGYMTVGELAKRMNATVRTLQYYDKIGLFPPASKSEGGRRLYTDKDVVWLHQILSLKSLGFSLDEIKNHLLSLETPEDVAKTLEGQAKEIKKQIKDLKASLKATELLKEEVLQMQTVHFGKYADIISSIRKNNGSYWMIKHFDDQFLDHVRNRFGAIGNDLGIAKMQRDIQKRAILLGEQGVLPESGAGQALAKEFWQMIEDFTGGDMSLLPNMQNMASQMEDWNEDWKVLHEKSMAFIEPALGHYFETIGHDPFKQEEEK